MLPVAQSFSQELPSTCIALQGHVCQLALWTGFTQATSAAPGLEIKTSEKEKPVWCDALTHLPILFVWRCSNTFALPLGFPLHPLTLLLGHPRCPLTISPCAQPLRQASAICVSTSYILPPPALPLLQPSVRAAMSKPTPPRCQWWRQRLILGKLLL